MQTNETQTELQQLALDLVRTQKQLASTQETMNTLVDAIVKVAKVRGQELANIQEVYNFVLSLQEEAVPVADFEEVVE